MYCGHVRKRSQFPHGIFSAMPTLCVGSVARLFCIPSRGCVVSGGFQVSLEERMLHPKKKILKKKVVGVAASSSLLMTLDSAGASW